MAKQRMIVEIETLEQARKVEETIKTGYIDACIENIFNWIAVEEDLSSSYEHLSIGRPSDSGTAIDRLNSGSKANVQKLSELLKTFESMDTDRKARIELLRSLEKR